MAAAIVAAGPVSAQDAPSWRALQEQPARPNPPPEIERPKYEFSVSRDELEGFSVDTEAVAGNALSPAAPDSAVPGPAATPTPAPAAVESSDRRVQIVAAPEVEAPTGGEATAAMAFVYSPEPVVTNPFDPLATDFEETGTSPPAAAYRLIRRRTVEPEYPRKASRDGIEGWVNLHVTVAPSGEVQDVKIVDADPIEIFDDSALRAVRKWRFEPPEAAGVTTPLSGMYRISFTMGER